MNYEIKTCGNVLQMHPLLPLIFSLFEGKNETANRNHAVDDDSKPETCWLFINVEMKAAISAWD